MSDTLQGGSLPGRALRRVFITLGVSGADGNLSFNKAITLGLFVCFVIILIRKLTPDPAVLAFGTFVGIAGFGLKAVMGYLDHLSISNTFTASSDVKLTGNLSDMIRAVKERRRNAVLEGTEDSGKVPQTLPVDG